VWPAPPPANERLSPTSQTPADLKLFFSLDQQHLSSSATNPAFMKRLLFITLAGLLGAITTLRAGTISSADHPPATMPAAAPSSEKVPVLIIDGINNHDWARATHILKEILEASGRFTVDVTTSPDRAASPEAWAQWRPAFTKYRAVISNFNSGHQPAALRWPTEVETAFESYVRNGGGFVAFHAANNAFLDWPAYNEMIGLGWRDKSFGPSLIIGEDEHVITIPAGQGRGPGHGPEHDFQVTVLTPDHPITRGLPKRWLHPHEQLTHGQHGPAKNLTVLTYAWSKDTKENEPLDWVSSYEQGRVYTTMLGHLWKDGPDTALRCAGFQTLFLRGAEWAATGQVTQPLSSDFPSPDQASLRQP
jgi:type 1 glutamine amidotransferase